MVESGVPFVNEVDVGLPGWKVTVMLLVVTTTAPVVEVVGSGIV